MKRISVVFQKNPGEIEAYKIKPKPVDVTT